MTASGGRLRVLVTNDDGVDAPGIAALAAAADRAGYEVVVAAPLREASGMSAALTAVTEDGRIVVERRRVGDLSGYGVAASPAYIVVLAALGAFGDRPDLVLSGINRGANAGNAVLHSGTVGAALTAGSNSIRAMAVSIDVLARQPESATDGPADAELHWSTAAEVAAGLFGALIEAAPGTVLNLNVPDRPSVAGIRPARLASFGQVQMVVAESGEGFVRTTVRRDADRLTPGTDLAGLAAGYATVTLIGPPAEAGRITLPGQRTGR
jgi:5'-nucleotidase